MVKSKRTGEDIITVPPITNAVLTTVFLAEVVGIFGMLLFRPGMTTSVGAPLVGAEAAAALAAACVVLFPTIQLVKLASEAVGGLLSRSLLKPLGDPLRKSKNMAKFKDQMWQLAIHVSMTLLEVWILYYDGGGEPWLDEYWSFWIPYPALQKNKPSVHLLYLLQMAIWIGTCFSHRFVEERHKDYVMMYVHHVVTIALVWGSYSYNYVRIGTVVLYLHDLSDIMVDLLKLTNYMKLEGPKGGFLVEICFFSNFVTWFYLRLYVYPLHVVWRGVIYGSREAITAPVKWGGSLMFDDVRKADGSEYSMGHVKGGALGDGSFDLLTNMWRVPSHEALTLYYESSLLLSALLVMHVIWYLMFWRILYRLLAGAAPELHDAGREVYEGGSDDEGDDAKKEK